MASENKSIPQSTKKAVTNNRREAARRRSQKRRQNQIIIISAIVIIIAVAAIGLSLTLSQPVNFTNLPATITLDERSHELGPVDAKVTVEIYGDYQCPFCQLWNQQYQPTLLKEFIESGKSVKYIFRDFPFLDERTASSIKESHNTVQAAYCAADQKRFWDYHNALYDNQPKSENSGYWSVSTLGQLAQALKLDTNSFNSCLQSNKYLTQANNDATAARNRGLNGTPSFYVNGKVVELNSYADLQAAINKALGS